MSEIKIGDTVKFTGYVGPDVAAQDDSLVVGEYYKVVGINDDTPDDLAYTVSVPSTSKRAKKPIEIDLFSDECVLVTAPVTSKKEAETPSTKATDITDQQSGGDSQEDDGFIDPDEAVVGTPYEVQMKDESAPLFTATCTKATKTLLYMGDTKYKKADIDALFIPEAIEGGVLDDSAVAADEVEVATTEHVADPEPEKVAAPAKKKPVAKKKSTTKPSTAKKKAIATPATEPVGGNVLHEDADVLALVEDSDDLCALAKECLEDTAMMEWRLGGVLHHVLQDKAYESISDTYQGSGGFERYCINDLGVKYRKARYLINIYVTFSNIGLTGADLARTGWTKARNLLKVITEDNAQDMLKLAEDNTVESLMDEIKIMEEKLTPDKVTTEVGATAKKMSMKFHYYEDEASFIANSLQQVMDSEGLETEAEAVYSIITQYMSELYEQ